MMLSNRRVQNMPKGVWIILLLVVVGVLVTAMSLVFVGRDRLWVLLLGPEDHRAVDFSDLERSGKPNDYVVCPPSLCGSSADEDSPEFGVPVELLREEFLQLAREQPRTVLLEAKSRFRFDLEQRSRWFRFPDTISVLCVALGEGRSTLAIYSRSSYGHSDLGVNRERVNDWLNQLSRRLQEREGN